MKLYFYTLVAVIFFQVTATADEVTFSEGTNFGISVSPDAKNNSNGLTGNNVDIADKWRFSKGYNLWPTT